MVRLPACTEVAENNTFAQVEWKVSAHNLVNQPFAFTPRSSDKAMADNAGVSGIWEDITVCSGSTRHLKKKKERATSIASRAG